MIARTTCPAVLISFPIGFPFAPQFYAVASGALCDNRRFTLHGSYRRFGRHVNKLHNRPVPSRNLNGRIGGGALAPCFADEEVAACDALPPPLRALIKGSFVNTKATTVLAQWREVEAQGVPLAAYVDWFAAKLAINMAKSCAAAYGPDHPNARPPLMRPPSQPQNHPANTPGSGDDSSRARAAARAAEIDLSGI